MIMKLFQSISNWPSKTISEYYIINDRLAQSVLD